MISADTEKADKVPIIGLTDNRSTTSCLAHGELAWLFSLEPDTVLDHCPRIQLSSFRARTSSRKAVAVAHIKIDEAIMKLAY